MSTVGGTSASTLGGPNYGELVVHLKPRAQRKELVERHHRRSAAASSPTSRACASTCRIRPPSGSAARSPRACTSSPCSRPTSTSCTPAPPSCEHEIEKLPEVEDVTSDLAIPAPQVNVTIDRDKAAALQVNADAIENAFYDAYGPRWVSTIYARHQRIQSAAGTEAAISRPTRTRSRCCISSPTNGTADPARHAGQAASRTSARRPSTTTDSSTPSPFRSI